MLLSLHKELSEGYAKINLAFTACKIDRKPEIYSEPCQRPKVKSYEKKLITKSQSQNFSS